MSNQVRRSNVLIQECSNFFCGDGLILTLNRDGDGFALLDAKSHDCHQLAHITGLAIFFNGDLAGILLCQLDQQTGGAGVDAKFVLDGRASFTGSALAWYISIPRLGLLALGEPQTL